MLAVVKCKGKQEETVVDHFVNPFISFILTLNGDIIFFKNFLLILPLPKRQR